MAAVVVTGFPVVVLVVPFVLRVVVLSVDLKVVCLGFVDVPLVVVSLSWASYNSHKRC